MSTSRYFDKAAALLIALALVFSIAIAMYWQPAEASAALTVSENDLAKVKKAFDLSQAQGDILIAEGGTYSFTGKLSEGQIRVEVSKTEKVVLILNGVSISNSENSPIEVANSGACAVYLAPGTENELIWGEEKALRKSSAKGESGGALLLKDSATILGSGSLTVKSYINNGIHCSNDLYIQGGSITVEAMNNGIKGKDLLVIDGGELTISAGNAGLKSGESGNGNSGEIRIDRGIIRIAQSYEGMEANQITVNDGQISVYSEDDGLNANGGSSNFGNGQRQNAGQKAEGFDDRSEGNFGPERSEGWQPSEGSEKVTRPQGGRGQRPEGFNGQMPEGFGAQRPGNTDGQMPEGFGAQRPESTDGQMPEGFGAQRPGEDRPDAAGTREETPLPMLTINGGYVYISAGGDGMDSNGSIVINDGTVLIDGPAAGADSALDCGTENGGQLLINGGTLLAIGSSGLGEAPDEGSLQRSVFAGQSFTAGSEIAILDGNGNTILTHKAAKAGTSLIFSSPLLEGSDACTLQIGGQATLIPLTGTVTTQGNAQSGMGGMGFGSKGQRGWMKQ